MAMSFANQDVSQSMCAFEDSKNFINQNINDQNE